MPDKNKELSKILLLTASVLLSGASVVFLLICLIFYFEGVSGYGENQRRNNSRSVVLKFFALFWSVL